MRINRELYASRRIERLLCRLNERDRIPWPNLLAALSESQGVLERIHESNQRIERNEQHSYRP